MPSREGPIFRLGGRPLHSRTHPITIGVLSHLSLLMACSATSTVISPIAGSTPNQACHLGDPNRSGLYPGTGVTSNPRVSWFWKLRGEIQGGAVSDGRFVYAVTDEGRACCIGLSKGKFMWDERVGDHGPGSAPLVTDSAVYFSSGDGRLHCLEKRTGKERWTFAFDGRVGAFERKAESSASPVLIGQTLVATGGSNGYVYGLEPESGKVKWRLLTARGVVADPVQERDDTLVVAGLDGTVHLLNANDGSSIANRSNSAWPWLWKSSHGIDDTPAIVGGRIIIKNMDGKIEVVSLLGVGSQGEVDWQWRSSYGPTTRASGDSTMVFVSVPSRVLALDINSGKPVWGYEMNARRVRLTPPSLTQRHVFVGDEEGVVWCLRRKDGQDEWKFEAGSPVLGVVTPVEDRVLFCTRDGRLICLQAGGQ